jgi:ribosomal protein S18 acetylase RimI-like enzyme
MKSMYHICFISFTVSFVTLINAMDQTIDQVTDQLNAMDLSAESKENKEKDLYIFFEDHGHYYNGSLVAYSKDPQRIRHRHLRLRYKIGSIEFKQSEHHRTQGFIRNLFITKDYTKYRDSIEPHLIVYACKMLNEAGCTIVNAKSPLFDDITLSFVGQNNFSEGHITAYGTDNLEIGVIGFKQNNWDRNKGYITNFYVAEEYKSIGLDKHLLEYACKFLYASGCSVIDAEIPLNNDAIVSFFGKNGFKEEIPPRNGDFDDLQDPLLCGVLIFRKNAPI